MRADRERKRGSGEDSRRATASPARAVAGRALVATAAAFTLFAGGAVAQLREVRQVIYGMD